MLRNCAAPLLLILMLMLVMLVPAHAAALDEAYVFTPKPSATPMSSITPKPTPTPGPEELPYRIYIEKGAFTIQVYGKDESGEFNVPIRAFMTAIGSGSKTPTGTFKILGKERWHAFTSSSQTRSYSYVQYATRFTGGLYIHSPLYTEKKEDTMIAATYREIGTKSTSGCLRLTAGAAYWIYENCPIGTEIVIVADAPLGLKSDKPPEIAERGKDPTDPKYAKNEDEETAATDVSLKLDKSSVSLKAGASFKLLPVLTPADADVFLDWSVSDAAVLSVDADGRVTALKPGKAKVTVISMQHNLSAECVVTVR